MSNAAKKQVENQDPTLTVVKGPEEPVITPIVETIPPELSIEEKIQRVEDLTVLIDKRRKLLDSRRSLQSFKVAADGYSNQLTLEDMTSRSNFKTYNSAVIARVMEVIRASVDEKLAEIEEQIRF